MSNSDLSRRKFFMHSAHKTIGVSAGLAALQTCDLTQFAMADEPAGDDTERALNVLLVSGSALQSSAESLIRLEKHLTKNTPIKCSRAFARANDELPGLEHLDRCDCMVLATQRLKIDGEPLERIKQYCRRGGAVVGIRTASHGLQNWLEMDEHIFGGDYRGHYDNKITEVELVKAAEDHPILTGVQAFRSHGTLYRNETIAKDATPLLTGEFPSHRHQVAWTRVPHGGRVFYTSLGHSDDFRQPNFLRLLSNALHWTCHARG